MEGYRGSQDPSGAFNPICFVIVEVALALRLDFGSRNIDSYSDDKYVDISIGLATLFYQFCKKDCLNSSRYNLRSSFVF